VEEEFQNLKTYGEPKRNNIEEGEGNSIFIISGYVGSSRA
jgi:hypothetical protein